MEELKAEFLELKKEIDQHNNNIFQYTPAQTLQLICDAMELQVRILDKILQQKGGVNV